MKLDQPERSIQAVSPDRRRPAKPFARDSASLAIQPCSTASGSNVSPVLYQPDMEANSIWPLSMNFWKSGTASTISALASSVSRLCDVTHRQDSLLRKPASKYGTRVSVRSALVR